MAILAGRGPQRRRRDSANGAGGWRSDCQGPARQGCSARPRRVYHRGIGLLGTATSQDAMQVGPSVAETIFDAADAGRSPSSLPPPTTNRLPTIGKRPWPPSSRWRIIFPHCAFWKSRRRSSACRGVRATIGRPRPQPVQRRAGDISRGDYRAEHRATKSVDGSRHPPPSHGCQLLLIKALGGGWDVSKLPGT